MVWEPCGQRSGKVLVRSSNITCWYLQPNNHWKTGKQINLRLVSILSHTKLKYPASGRLWCGRFIITGTVASGLFWLWTSCQSSIATLQLLVLLTHFPQLCFYCDLHPSTTFYSHRWISVMTMKSFLSTCHQMTRHGVSQEESRTCSAQNVSNKNAAHRCVRVCSEHP